MGMVGLAFGIAILLGIMMVTMVVLFFLTGWRWLLLGNLVVVGLAVAAFAYLLYLRSKVTIRP